MLIWMMVAADKHIMTGGIFLQLRLPQCSVLLTCLPLSEMMFPLVMVFLTGKLQRSLRSSRWFLMLLFLNQKNTAAIFFFTLNPILITFVSKIRICNDVETALVHVFYILNVCLFFASQPTSPVCVCSWNVFGGMHFIRTCLNKLLSHIAWTNCSFCVFLFSSNTAASKCLKMSLKLSSPLTLAELWFD